MKRSITAALTIVAGCSALALGGSNAAAAGARTVVVVNLLTAPARVTVDQGYRTPTAVAEVPSRRDHSFSVPLGNTSVDVTSSDCSGAKRIALPIAPTVRVVINAGCYLSIQ